MKDRKRRPKGMNESLKLLSKHSDAVLKSPPNTRSKHRDVHDPKSGWMLLRNTAGRQETLPEPKDRK
jgi:hypothetical protein